jgi:hypothetical protein
LGKAGLTEKPAARRYCCAVGWLATGHLVEEYPNGEKVVFVPLSPKTTDREVYLVARTFAPPRKRAETPCC